MCMCMCMCVTGALDRAEARRREGRGQSVGHERATYGALLGTATTLLWPKVISRRASVVLVVTA